MCPVGGITKVLNENGEAIIEAIELDDGSIDNCLSDFLEYKIDGANEITVDSANVGDPFTVTLTVTQNRPDGAANPLSDSCTTSVTVLDITVSSTKQ